MQYPQRIVPARTRRPRVPAGALFLLSACTGSIGSEREPGEPAGPPTGGSSPSAPAPSGSGSPPTAPPGSPPTPPPVMVSSACRAMTTPRPGPSALRRLTRTEYDNTVADLLGQRAAAAAFPLDQLQLGFDNNADVARPSELLVEQYEAAADRLATKAVQDLPALTGCRPADPAAEDACARQFLQSFGLRAYRRPLTKEETDSHFAFYASMKAKYGHGGAVKVLVQAMLQSPYFLYRVEGPEASPAGAVVKAGPFELASRLSYFLWASMPDKALLDAAAAGMLSTAAEIEGQAQRMLADPRARQGVGYFFAQWLELSRLDRAQKDAAAFPKWNTTVAGLLRQESETFVQEQVLRDEATLGTLLTAPFSYLNKDLATFYGVAGASGAAFQKVMLNSAQRAGVLTHGSFLASAAKPNQTAPVARGLHVRDRLLCAPPPPPPDNANTKFPEPDGKSTTRERLAQHREDPACAGCHALFDPIGLGFEHYDAVGLWRDRDAGKIVDATGEVAGAGDADGKFDGAMQLAGQLARSSRTTECVARQYFRFAFGRAEDDTADACTIQTLTAALASGSVRQFLVALTTSDPFRYRTVVQGGAP